MLNPNTQTTQLKFTIPVLLKKSLEKQASRYGMTLPSYLRQRVSSFVINEQENLPEYEMSDNTLKSRIDAEANPQDWVEIDDLTKLRV